MPKLLLFDWLFVYSIEMVPSVPFKLMPLHITKLKKLLTLYAMRKFPHKLDKRTKLQSLLRLLIPLSTIYPKMVRLDSYCTCYKVISQ